MPADEMSYGLLERLFPKKSTMRLTCHSEHSEESRNSFYRMSDDPTARATARPFASLRLPAFLSGAWWPVAQGDKGVNDLSLPFVTGPEGFFRTFEMQDSIAREAAYDRGTQWMKQESAVEAQSRPSARAGVPRGGG